ncbi:hypothetical protein ACHAW5_006845 [Stephanodiscus triporus]|uniref:Uncharacterized protein n=1 Tax=Stephanodiscus triporus TaxID=2934178 RepID=A0ABD3PXN9_9STRA
MTSKKVAAAASVILSLIFSFASGFNHPSARHHAAISSSSLRRRRRRRQSSSSRQPTLRMSAESEVDRLRAAAAKAREEYEALVGKRGGGATTTTTTSVAPPPTARKILTVDEARIVASAIDFASGDVVSQTSALDALVDSGDFGLWKSAVRRRGGPTSTGSSSSSLLVPFPVTLEGLERRTDGTVTRPSLGVGGGDSDVKFEDFRDLTAAVVLGSTLLGVLALAVLLPNVGATFTYLLALVPIGFIGIGSVAPGVIAGVIVAARGGKGEDAGLRRERMCRHEAGHFLCGYACGLPVRGYAVDSGTGVARVEFHPEGYGSVDGSGGRELSDSDIARLSVVAMSGSVAEIMAYGKATGGEADLLELQNCFRRSKDFIGAARQQGLTRWGALTSYGIIKSNMGKYEALVRAFEENKSLADCVSIIEATG